ncbi:uncharacterized protein LOC141855047 [Brevipalpus obovatus]|uniref:uncharacterized protein LOC141855047 n=1 Tax=Brevipalpus obovatus TaxID=246614 RepID=UPI003D9EBFB0
MKIVCIIFTFLTLFHVFGEANVNDALPPPPPQDDGDDLTDEDCKLLRKVSEETIKLTQEQIDKARNRDDNEFYALRLEEINDFLKGLYDDLPDGINNSDDYGTCRRGFKYFAKVKNAIRNAIHQLA